MTNQNLNPLDEISGAVLRYNLAVAGRPQKNPRDVDQELQALREVAVGVAFNERQRRLLWEVLTLVDPEALNVDLERVGQPRVTLGESELTELMDMLDRDNRFRDEWADVPPP